MSYRESVTSLKILKDLYKNRPSALSLFKSLENSSQLSLENFSINLQTIENHHGKWDRSSGKSATELKELFSGDFPARKLLVLGSPGMGKTSFLQNILYKWSRNQLWSEEFECMYSIKLRVLLNKSWQREYSGAELKENLLKCFVHYNIVMYSDEKRDPTLRLDNLYWPKDKSKVLLLIDGYDEIKEIREREDFRRLEKEISLHENLIVTSKSNAVDDYLKSQFDRTIEVVGLDRSQICSIIKDYFRCNDAEDESRAKGLKDYLVENVHLEELCKTPINLQMLCFLWNQDEPTRIPASLSQLYEEVVNVLARKYFVEKAENKDVDLDELTLLSFIAFQATTAGETRRLVFEGNSDENEVSIQWCIDELVKRGEIKEGVTIREAYNFGLLEIQKPGSSEEQDLSGETFSFVHECFQDYFTAHYLVRTLLRNNEEEGSKLYEFIAIRRNEPEYMMVLKLMAGLIENLEDGQPRKKEVAGRFWEAMTCNIDGVIELGVEAKVTLLMHLLSQVQKEDAIVNVKQMKDLIDGVILSEILEWGTELKESGYMSREIKEGLLRVLTDGNVEWSLKTVREISDRSEAGVMKATLKHLVKRRNEPFSKIVISKNNTSSSLGKENISVQAVEIVSDLLEKFSSQEQKEVILEGFLKAFHEAGEDGEVRRRVLAAMGKLVLLNPEGCLERKDGLLEILIPSSFDNNLEKAALKASGNLIRASKTPSISYEILCRMRAHDGILLEEDLIKCFDKEASNYALKELIEEMSKSSDMEDQELGRVIQLISLILACQPGAEEVPHAVEILTGLLTHISGGIRDQAKAGLLKGWRDSLVINEHTIKARDNVLLLLNKDAPQELDDLSMILKKIMKDQESIVRTIFSFIDEEQQFGEELSSPLKINATKAISNLMDSVKDKELEMKIKSRWIRFLHEEDENVRVQAIKALLKWFEKTKNKDLVQDILSILPALFEDEFSSGEIRKIAVECLESLAGFIAEKSLQKRILRRMIKMSSDEDRTVRHEAQRGILTILRINQDKELMEVARKGLINLLQQEKNEQIIEEICSRKCIGKLLRMNFDEKLANTAIASLLSSSKTSLKHENVALVIEFIKMAPQSSVPPTIALDALYKILNTSEAKERAVSAITEVIKVISDSEVPQDIIRRLQPLMENPDKDVIEIFGKILEAREDYTFANEAMKILLPLMQQKMEQENTELQISLARAVNNAISQGARVTEQDLVRVQIELQYSEIFACVEAMKQCRMRIERWAHDQPKIGSYANAYIGAIKSLETLYKDKEEQIISVGKLSDMMVGFHEVRVVEAIEALISLICESSQVLNITEDCGYKEITGLAVKLIRSTGNRRLAGSVVERLVGFLEKSEGENGVITRTIVEISKTFMLARKDLRRLLENKRLRMKVKEGLGEAFEELVEKKLKVMDEMVNYEGMLKVRTINGRLFGNKLKKEIQGQLEDAILEIKHQNGSTESRQKLQRIMLRELNEMENINFWELIEMALTVIRYKENDNAAQLCHKEQAKALLDYEVKWMEMEGLTYVNENFEYLGGLSKESRVFFGKLFHKILKDFDISVLKEELLVGLINEGLVITIHREGKVFYEGEVYRVMDQQRLEKILKTVIYQEQDALTLQYKQHEPLFPSSVAKKAAVDVGSVKSIVENSYELTEKNWLFSKLKGDDGQILLILEQRNVLGDHIIYEVNRSKLLKIHPLDLATEKLIEIIGEYKGQEAYYGMSKKIDVAEGSKILNGMKVDFENISGEKIGMSKMYFHDELIRSSKNDRLVFEMKTNMEDSARRFETELQLQGLSESNKEKLLDYYKAFTRTFEDAFVASQSIVNNESVINTAETRGSSILTNVIISTPPRSPQKRLNEMESMGEYVKNQTMTARAKRILQIGTDILSFDQVVGELAFQTTLDQRKQDEILSKEEEKGGSGSGKEEQVVSFYKQMQGEGRQQFEDNNPYKKMTLESLLGKADAQIAIEDWISQKGMVSEQREKIVSVGSIQSQLLQKKVGAQQVRNGLREFDNRQCCCQIF